MTYLSNHLVEILSACTSAHRYTRPFRCWQRHTAFRGRRSLRFTAAHARTRAHARSGLWPVFHLGGRLFHLQRLGAPRVHPPCPQHAALTAQAAGARLPLSDREQLVLGDAGCWWSGGDESRSIVCGKGLAKLKAGEGHRARQRAEPGNPAFER